MTDEELNYLVLVHALEAAHRAEQEKSAAREAVIEKAAALIDQPDTWGAPTLSAGAGWAARALFDAGLLADPDVEGDQ